MHDKFKHKIVQYRVVNDWTGKTIACCENFDDAYDKRLDEMAKNKDDEIIIVAVISID